MRRFLERLRPVQEGVGGGPSSIAAIRIVLLLIVASGTYLLGEYERLGIAFLSFFYLVGIGCSITYLVVQR
ncbi:MAG: hypothetical protein HY706_10830, partial [Candidatus Hydrogenedentes bacterium]|nr:hypothetical protein [Candidatus Hydrogenedentota bacterium]